MVKLSLFTLIIGNISEFFESGFREISLCLYSDRNQKKLKSKKKKRHSLGTKVFLIPISTYLLIVDIKNIQISEAKLNKMHTYNITIYK